MGVIKSCLRPLLFYGGFPFVRIAWRRMLAMRRVFILMYHRVDYLACPFFEIVVRPEAFEKQIRFLRKYYEIVDLGDLKRLEAKRTSKKDFVVLTFDDGYRDNYTHAFPILQKYQAPATIFLATRYINANLLLWYDQLAWILYNTESVPDMAILLKHSIAPELIREVECFFLSSSSIRFNVLCFLTAKLKTFATKERERTLSRLAQACKIKRWPRDKERPMLSWEEVREMSKYGISFGSHTMSHPVLSAIPTPEARREIVESKNIIEEQIQKPVTTFAYPYGKKEDYTDEVTKILIDEGFEYACTTTMGYEQFPVATPLELKRRGVPPHPYLFL